MAKKDILLRAGITFNANDVDTTAIKDALIRALSSGITLQNLKLGTEAKRNLKEAIQNVQFRIDSVRFGRKAFTSLRKSLRESGTGIVIDNAKFSAGAIAQLNKQLSGEVTATVSGIRQPARGGGRQASAASRRGTRASRQATDANRQQAQSVRDLIAQQRQFILTSTPAERATLNFLQTIKQGSTSLEGFGAKIAQITTRFTAYLLSLRLLFAAQQAFNNSLKVIFEFDNAIQDLAKVVDQSEISLGNLSNRLFEVAQRTGNAVTAVAESFGVFIRQGNGAEEALRRTEAALIAVNVSELSVSESTRLITSTLQVFGSEIDNAIQALDLLSVTADNAGTSAGEVARGILRSGAAAEAVGISFRQLSALIAATEEATKLGGSRIGSAFKTIFARLAANEDQLRDQANAFGALIQPGEDLLDILGKLSEIFPNLNRNQKAQITQIVAGKRRFTEFNAVLSSFNRTTELLEKQQDSAGVAARKNERELEKLSTQAQQVKNAFSEFIVTLAGVGEGAEGAGSIREFLSQALNIAKDFAQGLTQIVNLVGSLNVGFFQASSIIRGIAKAGFFVLVPIVLRRIIAGFKSLIGIGTSLNTSLGTLARSQQGITAEVTKTNIEEEKRAAILRRQLDLITQQARASVRARRARGAGDAPSFIERGTEVGRRGLRRLTDVGRSPIGQIGGFGILLGVTDDLTERFREQTEALRETGDGADKFRADITDAGLDAASFGLQLGLLAGPMAGLAGAAVIAAKKLTEAFVDVVVQSSRTVSANEALRASNVVFAQTVNTGSKDLQTAFSNITNVDAASPLEKQAERLARALDLVIRSAVDFSSDNSRTQRAIINSQKLLGDSINESARQVRQVDLAKEFLKIKRSLQGQAIGVALDISAGGEIGAEFRSVEQSLNNILSAANLTSSSFGDIESSVKELSILADAFNVLQKEGALSSIELLKNNDALGPVLDELVRKRDGLSKQVNEQADELEKILSQEKTGIDFLDQQEGFVRRALVQLKQRGQLNEDEAQQFRNLVAAAKTLDGVSQDITKAFENLEKAGAKVLDVNTELEKLGKERLKNIGTAINNTKALADAVGIVTLQIEKQNVGLSSRIDILESERSIQRELAVQAASAVGLAEQEAAIRARIRSEQTANIRQLNTQFESQIALLEQARKVAIALQQTGLGAQIAEQIRAVREVQTQRISELEREAEIKIQARFEQRDFDNLESAEGALKDFRLESIRSVVERERQAAQERLAVIRELAQTTAGRQTLFDEGFRPSAQLEREFGTIGSIIVAGLEQAAEESVAGIVDEFDEFRINAISTIDDLRTAEEKRKNAANELNQLVERGADPQRIAEAKRELENANTILGLIAERAPDAFERLARAQETEGRILEINEQLIADKRKEAIDNVRRASDAAATAEKSLVEERNKIPALNAKIIESQRQLATASDQVDQAQSNLISAFQALADAQVKLNFSIELAGIRAQAAAGSFRGVQDTIDALAIAFESSVGRIKASQEAILEIRRQVLQEELSLVQNQLSQLQSLFIEAATASQEDLFKLQESAAAAAAIAGGAPVEQFSEEILSGVGRFIGVIEGLEQELISQGASRLGIDAGVVETLQSQLVELSRSIAETQQTQVAQAEQQVITAREQLDEARAQKDLAQQQLDVAITQKEAQLTSVGVAQANLSTARIGFARVSADTRKVLQLTQRGTIASDEIKAALDKVRDVQEAAKIEIEKQAETARQNLGLNQSIDASSLQTAKSTTEGAAIVASVFKVVNILPDTLQRGTTAVVDAIKNLGAGLRSFSNNIAGSRAGGSLTAGEFAALAIAAQREKSAMPGGSRLVVANTSETILNRRQARRIGLSAGHTTSRVANAQGGFAETNGAVEGIFRDLSDQLNTLEGALNRFTDASQRPSNVNVQVDSARRVEVQGLDAINAAVRTAFEAQLGNVPSKAETNAISNTIVQIIEQLREGGLEGLQNVGG
jgi:TP901 family phage tail tape measure protein